MTVVKNELAVSLGRLVAVTLTLNACRLWLSFSLAICYLEPILVAVPARGMALNAESLIGAVAGAMKVSGASGSGIS